MIVVIANIEFRLDTDTPRVVGVFSDKTAADAAQAQCDGFVRSHRVFFEQVEVELNQSRATSWWDRE